jgi:hypothetical protein
MYDTYSAMGYNRDDGLLTLEEYYSRINDGKSFNAFGVTFSGDRLT